LSVIDKHEINSLLECWTYINSGLEEIKINDRNSLKALNEYCWILAVFCLSELIGSKFKMDALNLANYSVTHIDLVKISSEVIGYWTHILERKKSAIMLQGANSKEIGDASLEKAKTILAEFGGISSYSSLRYGQKKPITNKIMEELRLKDIRHVYNIIKKIKSI